MKKYIIILSVLTFVSNAATEISFSKTFEKKIKPDTLSSSIGFSSTRQDQQKTIERLTVISDYVSSIKNLKIEGGSYSVNPHIVYDNGKSNQDGYDGYMNYNVLSKNPKELNKFIREIQRLGEKQGLSVSVSNVSWQLSEELSDDRSSDTLRLDAILWAKNYANVLSSKLSKSCSISKIDFNGGGYVYAAPRMAIKAEVASNSAPTPIQDEQKVQVNANITVVCR
ncbi:MAG: SIMPL domain-containing protein [Epsilonproteobacteria bacterium]|nr:SIMPL domain-containing protein [Campylobacterota bacterium]